MLNEQLVPVFSTTSITDAEILRNVIKEDGIPCELENEHQAGLSGLLEIKGLVLTSHEVRAKLLLAKHQKQRDDYKLSV